MNQICYPRLKDTSRVVSEIDVNCSQSVLLEILIRSILESRIHIIE